MADRSHTAQHTVSQRQLIVLLGHINRRVEIKGAVGVLMVMTRLLLIAGTFIAHCMRISDGAKGGGRQEQCRNNEAYQSGQLQRTVLFSDCSIALMRNNAAWVKYKWALKKIVGALRHFY